MGLIYYFFVSLWRNLCIPALGLSNLCAKVVINLYNTKFR